MQLETIAANLLAQMGQELLTGLIANPAPLLDGLEDLFDHHHTGYDACADILDAVEGGHIGHGAALQAIALLLADMQRREQRDAAPTAPRSAAPRPRSATAPAVEFDLRSILGAIAQ